MMGDMDSLTIETLASNQGALDTVAQWIDNEWGAFSGRSLLETRTRFQEEVAGCLPVTLVALHGGRVLGLASLRGHDSRDWDPSRSPWVCNVYVEARVRGKGIAERLCLGLEDEARELGFANIFLASIRPDGSLYERIGYRTYGSVPLGDGRMFLMEKSLTREDAEIGRG